MAENSFRILLDFRELNFKFYKFVWMSILPRELVTIKDLKDAILKKFSFEQTDLLLFLRDGLLPEDENISNILRENDSVRLFYAESSILNPNESKTTTFEESEPSTSDAQATSSKKRKTHADVSTNSEVSEHNKKRKHSFSNGTYLFENNGTSENSALVNTSPVDRENVNGSNSNNFENLIINSNYKSCKIKKKLKYTNDVTQNSLISENETLFSSDTIPRSEKIKSSANACKKKKKHKHSKDVSEKEIMMHNDISSLSEVNNNEPKFHEKKRKPKHSHKTSKTESMYKTTVSFSDEINFAAEKLDDSINSFKSLNNEPSELKESIFETIIDDSGVQKPGPVSFCISSVNTSSGIGSLKSSEENNQNASPKKIRSKSYVTESKLISELERNNLSGQGNSCKKKKRKRHRKRKPVDSQTDISEDWNLNESPQKIENLDPSFASSAYQTAEISTRNIETPDSTKSNSYLSGRNGHLSVLKKDLLEQFNSGLLSASTPFSQTNVAPSGYLKNKAIFKIPSCSVSQDQSCAVPTTSEKPTQKKMVPTKINLLKQKGNSLTTYSVSGDDTKSKNNATTSSGKLEEKSISSKRNCFPEKSIDSLSNVRIESQIRKKNFSYEDCPPLNSCPLVGTRIAYKVLELDASYSPVVSNYKEGVVKAVNSQTDELEIELIEPEVKEGRTGKFENLYEDEMPPCEVVRKVTLSWPSLINPVQVVRE